MSDAEHDHDRETSTSETATASETATKVSEPSPHEKAIIRATQELLRSIVSLASAKHRLDQVRLNRQAPATEIQDAAYNYRSQEAQVEGEVKALVELHIEAAKAQASDG